MLCFFLFISFFFSRQVDGKLLCWLCTLSYKRALTKARQVENERRRAKKRAAEGSFPPPLSGSGTSGSGGSNDRRDRMHEKMSNSGGGGGAGGQGNSGGMNLPSGGSMSGLPPLGDLNMGLGPGATGGTGVDRIDSGGGGGGGGGGSGQSGGGRNDNGRHSSSSKKPRSDTGKMMVPDMPTDKLLMKSANSGSGGGGGGGGGGGYVDPHSSDHVIAMTQLKETIATLQRKLKQKDGAILEKEKEISAWKGKHFHLEQELMKKYKDMEKNYEFKLDVLNKKLKAQLLEIAALSKAVKERDESKKKKVVPSAYLATTKLSKISKSSGDSKDSTDREKSVSTIGRGGGGGGRNRMLDDDDDDDEDENGSNKEDKENDSEKGSDKGGSGRNTPRD
uniref:Uncharacterized protein n=1 Tax=Anopheles maculatus TaxID=74869 RepID=A0A182T3K2_9DIPT